MKSIFKKNNKKINEYINKKKSHLYPKDNLKELFFPGKFRLNQLKLFI